MENKKVKIRYLLNNRLDNSWHHILVFDDKNEMLYDGYTDMKGYFSFQASYFGIYKIVVLVNGNREYEVIKILVQEGKNNCFIFRFNDININLHTITILVTDRNYQGLPIEKGEMSLWLKNT